MKKHLFRRNCAVFLAIVTASATMQACAPAQTEVKKEPVDQTIEVETTLPEVRDVSISSNFAGGVEADSQVVVMSKVSGEVTQKNYEVGDHVTAGDLLFTIDDTSAKIAVEQAAAGVNSAEAGLGVQEANRATVQASAAETLGVIATNEMQLANAVDSANAGVKQACYSYDSAVESARFAEDQVTRAEDNLDDAEKAKKKAKKAYNELKDLQDSYNSAARKGDEQGQDWLKKNGYSSASQLSSAVSSAKSAYESAKSAEKSMETALESAKLQRETTANSAGSAQM
ncbi:MAG: biotin/lipoyl-binding protein, partial [Lachnospiraceae bacterium]|nr:biotin/lipoyl-binding protein [Lachnospiraceae bacterium]